MPHFDTVWPVASFVFGAALAQLNSSLAEKRQNAREREAREYETSKAFLEGKKNFEIQVLSDVYGTLNKLRAAADALARWHRSHEGDRDSSAAEELCSRLQSEAAEVWRLNELLFDDELNELVTESMSRELFPDGPRVIPAQEVLEGYGDSIWDAHAAVAEKLKKLYTSS
ncbi:hypothetical protein AB0F03_06315 [Streptomyces sp. NPDC028722]|uniref:hypothetical protein n=1 Tax=Streptomyces sp. NPDC028722 TaxID=3155016 RepID=UPI0033EDF8CD